MAKQSKKFLIASRVKKIIFNFNRKGRRQKVARGLTTLMSITSLILHTESQARGLPNHIGIRSPNFTAQCIDRTAASATPKELLAEKVLPLIKNIQDAQSRGDMQTAERLARETARYLETNDRYLSFPLALTQLSEILSIQDKNPEAIRVQEKAIAVVKSSGYSEHRFAETVFNQLMSLYARQGNIQKALETYREFRLDSHNALVCKTKESGSPEDKAALSRFVEAVNELHESKQYRKAPDWAKNIPEVWETLLSSYYYAISMITAIEGNDNVPPLARSKLHSGAGSIAFLLGDTQASLDNYKKALKILQESQTTTDVDLQTIVPGIRDAYFRLGKFKEAKDIAVFYAEYIKKVFGDSSHNHLTALQSVANAFEGIGDLERAESILQEVSDRGIKKYSGDAQARVAENHAVVLAKMGRGDKAIALLEKAYLHRLEAVNNALKSEINIARLSGLSYTLRTTHLDRIAALAAALNDRDFHEHALRASALIKNLEASSRRKHLNSSAQNQYMGTWANEFALDRPASLAISENLRKDEAYIEILKHPAMGKINQKDSYRYMALIVEPNAQPRSIDLGTAAEIETEINDLLRSQSEDLDADSKNDGKSIPWFIKKMISGLEKKSQIFINPDGEFSRIPLGLMRQFLKNEREGSEMNLQLVLNPLPAKVASEASGLYTVAIVNPLYASRVTRKTHNDANERADSRGNSAINTARLPNTEKEGEIIARLFNGNVFKNEFATADLLLSIHRPKVLHVAAHGFFLPDLADASSALEALLGGGSFRRTAAASTGLVLAPSFESQQGYSLVTADQIARMDLEGTELVVLSACSTGSGILGQGSALSALGASAISAGSHNVLLTLWPVEDQATASFMESFYTLYAKGMSPSEALSTTQDLFSSGIVSDPEGQNDWKRPYYWAGFQLMQGTIGSRSQR